MSARRPTTGREGRQYNGWRVLLLAFPSQEAHVEAAGKVPASHKVRWSSTAVRKRLLNTRLLYHLPRSPQLLRGARDRYTPQVDEEAQDLVYDDWGVLLSRSIVLA